ncbi:MAG: hypothetical protein U9R65_18930, partial [Pseudomonadota bacterium]|nr:hypothetical protein [Pseudomonadota bacterium]
MQQLIQSEADEARKRELLAEQTRRQEAEDQQKRFQEQADEYRKQIEEQQQNTWGQVKGQMESMAEAFATSVKDLSSSFSTTVAGRGGPQAEFQVNAMMDKIYANLGISRPEAEKQYPGGKAPWTDAERAARFAAGTGSIRDLILGAGSDIYQAGGATYVLDQAVSAAVSEMARRGIEPGNPRFPAAITEYMKGLISQGIIQFGRNPKQSWLDKQPKDKPKVYTAKDGREFGTQAEADAHDAAAAAQPTVFTAADGTEFDSQAKADTHDQQQIIRETALADAAFTGPQGALASTGDIFANLMGYDDGGDDTDDVDVVVDAGDGFESVEPTVTFEPEPVVSDPTTTYEVESLAQTPWSGGWAGGGPVFRDTLALVGEEGPEYVKLPRGARVIPADATREMMRGRRPIPMQEGGKATGQGLVFGPEEQERTRTLGWGDVTAVGGEGGYFTTTEGLAALRGGARREEIPSWSRAEFQAGIDRGESYARPSDIM